MSTLTKPKNRNEWFRDLDRVWTTSQHREETKSHTFDWADDLASGETISSSSWSASGVTTSSPSSSTTTTTVLVTGTNGALKNTVVTSAGQTLVLNLRFVGVPEGQREGDYGG